MALVVPYKQLSKCYATWNLILNKVLKFCFYKSIIR